MPVPTHPLRRSLHLFMAFTLVLSQLMLLAPSPARAAGVSVNATADHSDLNPGDGACDTGAINTEGSPECTLRAAIEEANASGPIDAINFSIPSSDPGSSAGMFTITPQSQLPVLNAPVSVDASTQPGFVASPIVILDGSSAGTSADGFRVDADRSMVRGFVISGFSGSGVEIDGDQNELLGNMIGLDPSGTLAHGNDSGVRVTGSRNTIGAVGAAGRNVISGNRGHGIDLDGANRTEVLGNYIGTNAAGDSRVDNRGHGVAVRSFSDRTTIGTGNVISGNGGSGVFVGDIAIRTTIESSHIGTDAGGHAAVPNRLHGIEVDHLTLNVTIGSAGPTGGNLISGNDGHGVATRVGVGQVRVTNNRVGTNAAGAGPVANGGDGLNIDTDNVRIEGNQVSGNLGDGIQLEQEGAIVRGNLIGTDATGAAAVGNGGSGIHTGSGTTGIDIGGTGAGDGNVIAFNVGDGISLGTDTTTQAAIVANAIFGNGHLGIDLPGNGPNGNDAGDGDSGPNDLLNHPVVSLAEENAGTVDVVFDLDVPNGRYRVEFFLNPSGADPSGYGEGESFVSAAVVQQSGGSGPFTHSFPGAAAVPLTATATRCTTPACAGFSSTSEFSPAFLIDVSNHAPILDPIADVTVDEESPVSFVASAADPDTGDALTFSLAGAPSGAGIDPTSGQFTWTPSESQGPASHTFDVTVTDGIDVASRTLTLTVDEVNQAPVIGDPGSHTIAEQTSLSFGASATDPDLPANTFTYGLAGAPSGATINPTTGQLTWTPTEAQGPGIYTFHITVGDGLITTSRHTTVAVTEANRPPTVSSPGVQVSAEGDVVDLAVMASDPDSPANTLTFSATGLPPGLDIDPDTGRITGTVQYHAAATAPHHVTITVSDDGSPSWSSQTSFPWHTANTNRPPLLVSVGERTVSEQDTVAFTFVAADPDPGTLLVFDLDGEPTGAAIDPITGLFTWTPTEAQGPGTYRFDVTVTDDGVPTYGVSRNITINVTEVNTPPVALGDRAVTQEDTPVRIPVLANDFDVDLPRNRLRVSWVGQPHGQVTANGDGTVTFAPAPDHHGTVTFDYTLSDGHTVTAGDVTVDVSPVNDSPVAADDIYRLVTYQPATLDVLSNDHDVDGDVLGLSLTSLPEVGLASLENGRLVYDPVSGWTGKVSFGYMVRDPHGARALATVEIFVGNEVLIGAQRLATDLGVDIVSFEPPTPSFDAATLSLINLDGITLLADSFFQTVDALRIPLGFLGVTVVMIVGFGAMSEVPALVFGARRRHWSVVRLGRQQRLPAYSEPGGRKVVYNYDPTATGIVSIGKTEVIGNTEWLPVDTPNGRAWIYRRYLCEQLDLQAFITDPRPVRLVHELASRLRNGRSIGSLMSDEGLVVTLTGSPSQIAPEELAALMGDTRLRLLSGIGKAPKTPEDFTIAVAQPFLESYDATPEVTAEVAHSRSALIPTECWNLPYIALGVAASGVQPWLVFFEYKDGKPLIAGLGIDE